MKILFLVRNFRQGWGGVPESARLMARRLTLSGISSDLFDRGLLHENIGSLAVLPEIDREGVKPWRGSLDGYAAIIQMGPWQDALKLMRLFATRGGQPIHYMPSGGLANIEFARLADIKKHPYFRLVERRFLKQSAAIIFTSEAERRETIASARHCARELVIPYLIDPVAGSRRASGDPRVTFSFLAEIGPRKGLLPLVDAFARWVSERALFDKVRLVIGGGARRGGEVYRAEVERLAASCPAIEMIGPVAHGDRPDFYGRTDIMAAPSLFESFGLTTIEALQHGCALLAAPDIGALEYLPQSDFITITRGAASSDLRMGLDLAYERFIRQGAEGRAQATVMAALAIDSINMRAMADWTGLLRR